jgi:hypothetical protein
LLESHKTEDDDDLGGHTAEEYQRSLVSRCP